MQMQYDNISDDKNLNDSTWQNMSIFRVTCKDTVPKNFLK